METFTAKAAADLSAHQYNIVRLSAENTVNVASLATTSTIAGVLLNKPSAAGQAATVAYFGPARVRAGAATATNLHFTCNGSGRAVAVASGGIAMGRILEAATADGDIVDCILYPPVRWAGAV